MAALSEFFCAVQRKSGAVQRPGVVQNRAHVEDRTDSGIVFPGLRKLVRLRAALRGVVSRSFNAARFAAMAMPFALGGVLVFIICLLEVCAHSAKKWKGRPRIATAAPLASGSAPRPRAFHTRHATTREFHIFCFHVDAEITPP